MDQSNTVSVTSQNYNNYTLTRSCYIINSCYRKLLRDTCNVLYFLVYLWTKLYIPIKKKYSFVFFCKIENLIKILVCIWMVLQRTGVFPKNVYLSKYSVFESKMSQLCHPLNLLVLTKCSLQCNIHCNVVFKIITSVRKHETKFSMKTTHLTIVKNFY